LTIQVKRLTLYTMRSTISSKGQITVPAELREELGLVPGTPVVFERRPEGALLRKGSLGEHPVDRLFGRLRLGAGVDAILEELRGPAPAGRAGKRKR
jgi:AbrB family looped-hinge helix DNA binding protein